MEKVMWKKVKSQDMVIRRLDMQRGRKELEQVPLPDSNTAHYTAFSHTNLHSTTALDLLQGYITVSPKILKSCWLCFIKWNKITIMGESEVQLYLSNDLRIE